MSRLNEQEQETLRLGTVAAAAQPTVQGKIEMLESTVADMMASAYLWGYAARVKEEAGDEYVRCRYLPPEKTLDDAAQELRATVAEVAATHEAPFQSRAFPW